MFAFMRGANGGIVSIRERTRSLLFSTRVPRPNFVLPRERAEQIGFMDRTEISKRRRAAVGIIVSLLTREENCYAREAGDRMKRMLIKERQFRGNILPTRGIPWLYLSDYFY